MRVCRIYGHFGADVSAHELKLASAAQRHGGPDAQHSSYGPGWGLGSNRLAITDPGGGRQPYELGAGIKAVFNGEVYNHEALRARLKDRGYRFPDACDGSVLPALYAEYGEGFAEHLDGMFAVALMDLRREPTLVLATDDAGMKPLYYRWDAARREVYFASELPALLALQQRRPAQWAPGLDAYLATKTPFGEETMVEGVRVLPPGATLVCSRSKGLRLTRRTARDAVGETERAGQELRGSGERVLNALRDEVRRLALADVPVCAVTSGGLDSSLVTALMAQRGAGPGLHTFNIAYQGEWPWDERHFAREVAELCGTRHHQVELDVADIPGMLPEVVWHLGQPNADPITVSTYALFEAVRAEDFKVALTGDAADEAFGGYARVKAALRADGAWIPAYVDALAAVPAAARERLYSSDYRAYVADRGSASDLIARRLSEAEAQASRLDVLTAFETDIRLPAYHLRRVDHLSMAHSVEVRLPFCQRPVSGLARSLPAAHRVDGPRGKLALYEAAAGLLPPSVIDRPKQPFTLPVTAMLSPGSPLTAYARELLSPGRLRAAGLLDPAAVGVLFKAQRERPADGTALAIWALMVFELWREQFAVATAFTPVVRERSPVPLPVLTRRPSLVEVES